ncbi:MAG: hypothetical protein JNJ54_16020 [Myxococcaceae bacterium]|nr:hypothetical protein [Myxococcaceae bacterium]
MRTTLTLDDDVAALLKRAMKESGRSLKDQVNQALRLGLTVKTPAARKRRAITRTYDGGAARLSFESTSEALALAEGDGFK